MFDSAVQFSARVLAWTFAVGLAGCVVVIPMVAFRLFRVLFEPDSPNEE